MEALAKELKEALGKKEGERSSSDRQLRDALMKNGAERSSSKRAERSISRNGS